MRAIRAVILAGTLIWSLGCDRELERVNTCGAISTSDYDQSCSGDADCLIEHEGDFCKTSPCHCAAGVISVNAREQYESDLQSRISTNSFACPCPLPGRAVCAQGLCVLAPLAP